MITLFEACEKVLAKHPDKNIHAVNEYDDVFQFILLNKGEEVNEWTSVAHSPYVEKQTGKLIDDAIMSDNVFDGEYRQYSGADIMSDFQIECIPYGVASQVKEYDIDRILFDLDSQIDLLSSQADKFDYLVSIGSGLLCAMLDILWVGEFSLERGRALSDDKVNVFVTKTAKLLGFEGDDLESAVRFLEGKFPIPSDGNTPVFGGGLQHHLRDFAHHPTIVGLIFSLLTQFTRKSYGTNVNGVFIIEDVLDKSLVYIGGLLKIGQKTYESRGDAR